MSQRERERERDREREKVDMSMNSGIVNHTQVDQGKPYLKKNRKISYSFIQQIFLALT
jgi:hypothetical protein